MISSFLGREIPLVYEIIEIDPPRRVLLRAETSTMTSLDEMTFDLRPGGGTIVTYDADLTMKGIAKLAELPMRLAFRRLGDNARDGLRNRLAEAPPARPGRRDGRSASSTSMMRGRAASPSSAAGSPGSWRPSELHAAGHEITVFEAAGYAGGHTNTITVDEPGGPLDVDTGFIVFNDRNYPNFERMLGELGVPSQPANMSFGVSDGRGGFEWAARGARGIFARPRHLVDPQFIRMLSDLVRFNREARGLLGVNGSGPSLGDFLDDGNYSDYFIDRLIVPQVSAVWSADPEQMWSFPASFLATFFENHGVLQIRNRPALADDPGRLAPLRRGADGPVRRPDPPRARRSSGSSATPAAPA